MKLFRRLRDWIKISHRDYLFCKAMDTVHAIIDSKKASKAEKLKDLRDLRDYIVAIEENVRRWPW